MLVAKKNTAKLHSFSRDGILSASEVRVRGQGQGSGLVLWVSLQGRGQFLGVTLQSRGQFGSVDRIRVSF